jgi:hypothetical protein
MAVRALGSPNFQETGAGDEARTRDPQLGRLMLYQLSYSRPPEISNPQSHWCRGEDSNLRRALARRVYSPVPLTTRPPLHALSKSAWSRRRDLNPRPSDYKSDALPTELRRPSDRQFNASSGKTRILPTALLKRKSRRTLRLNRRVFNKGQRKMLTFRRAPR